MRNYEVNIGFLVNATYELGIGNVVRCLNLAKVLFKNKHTQKIYFFSKNFEYTNNLINNNNFELRTIPDNTHELTNYVKKLISKLEINILIIDIPELKDYIIQSLYNPKLVIIILDTSNEDFVNRSDIIFNIQPYLKITKKNENQVYQGIKYWIINPKLTEINLDFRISKEVNNILITFGATDPFNLTKKTCLVLEKKMPTYNFNIIIGPKFKEKKFYKQLCEIIKNFNYIENPDNFYELMVKSDISFSAGGGTLFELMYIGVPTIIIPNTDDNLNLAKTVAKKKMAIFIETQPKLDENKLFGELFRLIEDYKLRKTIHFNCKKYFHENGAIYIEKILFKYLNQHPEKLLSR